MEVSCWFVETDNHRLNFFYKTVQREGRPTARIIAWTYISISHVTNGRNWFTFNAHLVPNKEQFRPIVCSIACGCLSFFFLSSYHTARHVHMQILRPPSMDKIPRSVTWTLRGIALLLHVFMSAIGWKTISDLLDTNSTHTGITYAHLPASHSCDYMGYVCHVWHAAKCNNNHMWIPGVEYVNLSLHEKWNNCLHPYRIVIA